MAFFFLPLLKCGPANEIMRGQSAPAIPLWAFLPLQLFTEGALFCCHVIIARKGKQRRRRIRRRRVVRWDRGRLQRPRFLGFTA